MEDITWPCGCTGSISIKVIIETEVVKQEKQLLETKSKDYIVCAECGNQLPINTILYTQINT